MPSCEIEMQRSDPQMISAACNNNTRVVPYEALKNQTAEFEFIKKTIQERGRAHLYAIHC